MFNEKEINSIDTLKAIAFDLECAERGITPTGEDDISMMAQGYIAMYLGEVTHILFVAESDQTLVGIIFETSYDDYPIEINTYEGRIYAWVNDERVYVPITTGLSATLLYNYCSLYAYPDKVIKRRDR